MKWKIQRTKMMFIQIIYTRYLNKKLSIHLPLFPDSLYCTYITEKATYTPLFQTFYVDSRSSYFDTSFLQLSPFGSTLTYRCADESGQVGIKQKGRV